MPVWVAFPCLDPSAEVTDPSASLGVVWARSPTEVKLVGSTVKGRRAGGYLTSKAFVLKGQDWGVHHVHLPPDPLLIGHTPSALGSSGGTAMIPLQVAMGRLKPMTHGQVCHQHSHNGGLGMPDLESQKISFPGPIFVERYSVGPEGEERLPSPRGLPQGREPL